MAMKRVGIHDATGLLIGSTSVDESAAEIAIGDLPTNGKFKLVDGRYIPIGHGFGKVKGVAPYSSEFVMARIIESLGLAAPIESREWLDWYNTNMRKRDEELARAKR